MAIYIISDLHLNGRNPVLTRAYESFLKRLLLNDQLFILGDFFDLYIGLDKEDRIQREVQRINQEAARRGVKIFFQRGNRDFLMTPRDASFFYMSLLPDAHIITTNHGRALLIHGDQLCKNDRSFQHFREMSRNRLLRYIFLHWLPLSTRRYIGQKIRNKSIEEESRRQEDPRKYGIVKEVAEAYMKKFRAVILIHGHFHRFGAHKDEYGENTYRLSLGMWKKSYSYFHTSLTKFEIIQRPMEKLF